VTLSSHLTARHDGKEEAMDMDLMDEFEMEDEAQGDEGQNRTFIILVAIMSGILLIGIIAFCVWALALGGLGGGGAAQETEVPLTADVAMVSETETAIAELTAAPEETSVPPTSTSRPPAATNTRRPTSTPAQVQSPTVDPTAASAAEVTPTSQPVPTSTPAPTTPTNNQTPDTGIGAFTAVIVAGVLFILLLTARRLRTVR
jgi:hypothetical protein